MSENKPDALASKNNCGVCGRPLLYSTDSVKGTCAFCGKVESALISCPEGHYICNECHSKAALEVLREVINTSKSTDPSEILEQVLAHPSVPMHGPEHHSIVPGVIIAAVRNAGYPVPDRAIEKALERAGKVPGGWCGLYGDCGAAVGLGVAVSVLTQATPLTGQARSLSMAATSCGLSRMLDDQPRCCKRATRLAVRAAVEFLRERLNINLPQPENVTCIYMLRNQQCPHQNCQFYSQKN